MLKYSEKEKNLLRMDAFIDQVQSCLKETTNQRPDWVATTFRSALDALVGESRVILDPDQETLILKMAIWGLAALEGRPLVKEA
jgi:hypothetical protein